MVYIASKGYFTRKNMITKLIKFIFALFIMMLVSIIMIHNNLSLFDIIRLHILMIIMKYMIIDLVENGE